jgi:thymidylate synthase
MIAHLTELTPGNLVYNIGDAHIYNNHIKEIELQLERTPRNWPRLEIIKKHDSIDEFDVDSFILYDYMPYDSIKAKMAV